MITNMLLHVTAVECVGPRTLRVWFDDDTVKELLYFRIVSCLRYVWLTT